MHPIFTSSSSFLFQIGFILTIFKTNRGQALFTIDFMRRRILRSQGNEIIIVKSSKVKLSACEWHLNPLCSSQIAKTQKYVDFLLMLETNVDPE